MISELNENMEKEITSWKEKYSVCHTRLMFELSCRTCKYKEYCEKIKKQGYYSLYDYYNKTKHKQI